MSDDGERNRDATYQQYPDRGLYDRIRAQRAAPEKRILRASERRWEGNIQILVDVSNGFDNRGVACFLRKIPPGGQSDIHRHNFEAVGYVLRGRGREIQDGEAFDFGAGDVVFIPANVWHQHVNTSPDEEALLLLMTNWPQVLHQGICRMEPVASWEEALSRPAPYPDPFLGGARNR